MPESKARRGGIARPYCDESQCGYRVRAACIAAKYSRVTGIYRIATTYIVLPLTFALYHFERD